MKDNIATSGRVTSPLSILNMSFRCPPPLLGKEKTMRPKASGLGSRSSRTVMIIGCLALLSPGYRVALAQGTEPPNATPTGSAAPAEEAPKIPNDQLDSLVAPIALYPDPLLAQTLAASTYPLEIIQLEQWMKKNKNLQGQALAAAVAKQPWDSSVQGLVEFPDV